MTAWIILSGLIALAGGVGFMLSWASNNVAGKFLSVLGSVLAFLVVTAVFSFHTVENGHIGIVKEFGSLVGTTGEGFQTTAPWQSLDEVSVQREIKTYNMTDRGDDAIGAAVSSDTQAVFMQVVVDYSLQRDKAVDLYRETGGKFVERLLDPAVPQLSKEVTAQYKAIDFAANRDRIRHEIEQSLSTELEPLGITINSVSLKNVDFTDKLSQAIEETVEAEQQAKRAQAQVAIREAEARQAVATAEGEAQALLTKATAEAKANRLVSESLTAEILQNRAIEKLNPNVQIIMVPAGQNFLLDTRSFLSTTDK